MKKILICGDTGFLGSNVFEYLTLKGYDVCGASRQLFTKQGKGTVLYITNNGACLHYNSAYKHYGINLCDNDCVKIMMEHCSPNYILNFVANPLVKLNEQNPTQIIDDNIKTTQLLCHHSPKDSKFIFSSSITVYGKYDKANPPAEQAQCSPISIYAITKLCSEYIINYYKDKITPIILRLGAIIGPKLSHGVLKDHLNKIYSNSSTYDILGEFPGSLKSYLHISDLNRLIDLLLNNNINGIFNINNEDLINIDEISQLIKNITKINKPINWIGNNWKGDNNILCADINKIKKYNWLPLLNSKEAIIQTIESNILKFHA